MVRRDLFFLGGLGVPAFLFVPWFILLRWHGHKVHVVPNSLTTLDPVSKFAESFIHCSSRHDRFDVLGVSYGGNAALYAVHLRPELAAKVRKMVLVCSPILGAPIVIEPIRKFLPGPFGKVAREMSENSTVTNCIRRLSSKDRITFDLHCMYHERDLMAPFRTATLPGVGTNHRLEFAWTLVPGMVMHQAACINPRTFKTALRILQEP